MSKDFIRGAIETLHSALEFCAEVDALAVKLFKSETKCEALLAQLADFDCRLTASEAERQRLRAEAVKCSAAAADAHRKLAAAAKNERGLIACMLEASGIAPELIPLTEVLGWMKWNAKCLAAAGASPADGAEQVVDAPQALILAELRKLTALAKVLVRRGECGPLDIGGGSPIRTAVDLPPVYDPTTGRLEPEEGVSAAR